MRIHGYSVGKLKLPTNIDKILKDSGTESIKGRQKDSGTESLEGRQYLEILDFQQGFSFFYYEIKHSYQCLIWMIIYSKIFKKS